MIADVIATLQGAQEPGRKLDAAIGRAIGLDVRPEFPYEPELGDFNVGEADPEIGVETELASYTASLDAALSLVKPEERMRVLREALHSLDRWTLECGVEPPCDIEGLPRFICIAALQARMAEKA